MRDKFEAYIVKAKGYRALKIFRIPGPAEKMLILAGRKFLELGAKVSETRNLEYQGQPSLIFTSPNFPLAIIVMNAQITDKEGTPLPEKESSTGLSALISYLEE